MKNLSVESLCFAYGTHEVLKGVTFETHQGELIFILGQNGAGKSTLFRCILGNLKPSSGSVKVDDLEVRNYKLKELAKKVAYIPQATAPTFNYSVRQMVTLGRTAHISPFASPGEKDNIIVSEVMDKLGILEIADSGFSEISGGQMQLALIARALAQQSNLLLMDEPTSSLDYGNQLRVLSQVKQLCGQGHSVIVTSHNPQHALLFADKVLALVSGTVRALGAPAEVLSEELIKELYKVDVTLEKLGNDIIILPKI